MLLNGTRLRWAARLDKLATERDTMNCSDQYHRDLFNEGRRSGMRDAKRLLATDERFWKHIAERYGLGVLDIIEAICRNDFQSDRVEWEHANDASNQADDERKEIRTCQTS